ncbi:hypothetical protein C8Q76DRAFT_774752, partial [Earliella scabrosa]
DDEDDDRRACRHSFHSRSLNLTSPLSFRPLLSFLCRLVAPPREQPARTRCHRLPAALHVLLIHDAPHASLHTRATLQSFGVLDLSTLLSLQSCSISRATSSPRPLHYCL